MKALMRYFSFLASRNSPVGTTISNQGIFELSPSLMNFGSSDEIARRRHSPAQKNLTGRVRFALPLRRTMGRYLNAQAAFHRDMSEMTFEAHADGRGLTEFVVVGASQTVPCGQAGIARRSDACEAACCSGDP